MDLRPPAAAAAALLAGCLLAENPAYKSTGESGDGSSGPATSGGVTCPDGQPGRAWLPDADRDGFGDDAAEPVTCDPPPGHVDRPGDCADDDPAIHPDAEEICNGRDDNCNGDDDELTKCDGCRFTLTEAYVYWACPLPQDGPPVSQDAARDRCRTFSARFSVDLVSVHSSEEHAVVSALADEHLGGYPGGVHAWIGLRKQDPYAADCDKPDPVVPWRWTDSSAVDNTKWNKTQPSGAGCSCGDPGCAPASCVELTLDPDDDELGWNDVACDAPSVRGYICKTARDRTLFPDP
jgi:hypothetical protein